MLLRRESDRLPGPDLHSRRPVGGILMQRISPDSFFVAIAAGVADSSPPSLARGRGCGSSMFKNFGATGEQSRRRSDSDSEALSRPAPKAGGGTVYLPPGNTLRHDSLAQSRAVLHRLRRDALCVNQSLALLTGPLFSTRKTRRTLRSKGEGRWRAKRSTIGSKTRNTTSTLRSTASWRRRGRTRTVRS